MSKLRKVARLTMKDHKLIEAYIKMIGRITIYSAYGGSVSYQILFLAPTSICTMGRHSVWHLSRVGGSDTN